MNYPEKVPCKLGVLAFGDSITNGGGELQWGVALQSWALWTARGLGLPFTSYATDGAQVEDVVASQIPAHARPDARYDLGCLYIGVNDVRSPDWDVEAFRQAFRTALQFLAARCDRMLAVTAGLAEPGEPAAELTKVGRAFAALLRAGDGQRVARRSTMGRLRHLLAHAG